MYSVPSVFGEKSLFDSLFADFDQIMKSSRYNFEDSFPPINLYINKDSNSCYYELALTGYKKEWLSVEIEGNNLTISAEVPEEDEDNKKYVKRRIQAKSFKKVYRIPEGYDTEQAEVTYSDGLLTIYIPVIKKEEPQTKKLEIK